MDPASTTFVVLAVYGGVLMVQERSWRGASCWPAVGAGLAISSKFSALPVLGVPLTATLHRGCGRMQEPGRNDTLWKGRGAGFCTLTHFLVAMLGRGHRLFSSPARTRCSTG